LTVLQTVCAWIKVWKGGWRLRRSVARPIRGWLEVWKRNQRPVGNLGVQPRLPTLLSWFQIRQPGRCLACYNAKVWSEDDSTASRRQKPLRLVGDASPDISHSSAATGCKPVWRCWPRIPRRTVCAHTARLAMASTALPDGLSLRLATNRCEISGLGCAWSFPNQVEMVACRAINMRLPAAFRASFAGRQVETKLVGVVEKNVFRPVAALIRSWIAPSCSNLSF